MKTLSIITSILLAFTGFSQTLPEDFEMSITTSDFTDFDGGVATVLPNPQSSGINPSATVGRIVRNGGQIWAGSKYSLASNIDFSTQPIITMKVYTAAPVGTVVKFKLENSTGGSTEVDVPTTTSNAWETMSFNFTGTPTSYNTIVLMFDFGNVGNGTATSTFLFDDIAQTTATLSQIDLPVTFEDATVDYTTTDFGGNASMMVVDPTDPTNTVMQVDKGATAQLWAGTTISTSMGFASAIPFTVNDTLMTVRVWSPTANTPIRLKVEDHTNGAISCETETNTTVAGAWETITFNFANEVPGTAALNTANTYDMASIFFNFGTDGATAGAQTYYFDDVLFGTGPVTLSQINLPVTFEDATVDYTTTDFGGNASVLVTDPTNPTNTVMEVEKTASAQLWAGTTISTSMGFASAIPFAVNDSVMSVRVWSPTANTPIRLKVEDHTNGAISCETETNTTVAGAWETLTFDFNSEVAGTPALDLVNTYDMASIFFNFGTDGATAGAQTYYFDDVMFGAPATPLSQIDLPVTFEDPTVDYTMTDFGGNASVLVTDPTDPTNTVMEVEKTASAQLWAGTTISTPAGFANPIPFAINDSVMTVRVWSPTANTPIRLKVEDHTNGTISCETETNTTVAGDWETLTFNFNNEVAGTSPLDLVNTYDLASIFFNFGTDGATAGAQTYYFDDVEFGAPTTPLNQIDMPVTFEDPLADYTMTDFGGNASTLITDPTDPANTVMEVIKTNSAQTWAGTSIGTPSGFATDIAFTATETFISVRVWSPTANTPIRLKVENSADNTQTCETELLTSVAGDWETLVFDFSNEVAGTPTLSSGLTMGWTYDLASIFFNFGTDGATAGEQTYYFDDVKLGDPFAGMEDPEIVGLSLYPNPSFEKWTVVSELTDIEKVTVFNLQGEVLLERSVAGKSVAIDATEFGSGVYLAYISTQYGTSIVRMVKK